jgi:3-oxoacyl-[acyl-carrier-protein] synthase III
MSAKIQGIGVYRPKQQVDSSELEKEGFKLVGAPQKRFFASKEETSVFMSVQSAKAALARANMSPSDIDFVLFFSGIPDYEVPKDGNLVLKELGATNANVWTLDTACASFISQMRLAEQFLSSGQYRNILLINTMNWVHRAIDKENGYTLVGDGSASVIVTQNSYNSTAKSISPVIEKTEPDYFDFLELRSPFVTKSLELIKFSHDPKHAKFFLKTAIQPAKSLLEKENIQGENLDWFVAHQTGLPMLERWCKALGVPFEKNLNTYHETANMSSVNIPYILHKYIYEEQKILPGQKLLFFAVGAGLHTATMLFQYE